MTTPLDQTYLEIVTVAVVLRTAMAGAEVDRSAGPLLA